MDWLALAGICIAVQRILWYVILIVRWIPPPGLDLP